MTRLKMDDIYVNPDIQQRVKLSQDLINEYVELMREGESLPPVVVFGPHMAINATSPHYYLSEGFHRYYVSERLGFLEIDAEIHHGGYEEAVDYACEANLKHGLRPSRADRLKAVTTQLRFHQDRSDREIARRCGVSPTTVGEYRKQLYPPPSDETAEPSAEPLTPVQMDSRHETTPVQDTPDARLHLALVQANTAINEALGHIPEADKVSMFRVLVAWIAEQIPAMPEGEDRERLRQATQTVDQILAEVEAMKAAPAATPA